MLNIQQIELNSTVEFEYYAEAIQGTGVKNAKVLAILDYEDAYRWINPQLQHAAVYTFLPSDVPNDYKAYPYLKLRLESGIVTAVGLAWIRETTWRQLSVTSLRFTIHGVAPDKRAVILQALAANGFTAVDVTELS
jgi:hypothetical protein